MLNIHHGYLPPEGTKQYTLRALYLLIACALLFTAWILAGKSFNAIQDSRDIMRLNLSSLENVAQTSGVYKFSGVVSAHKKTVRAPFSEKDVIYTAYRVQEKRYFGLSRKTTTNRTRYAPSFILTDNDQSIVVQVDKNVRWVVEQNYRSERDSAIFTERSIAIGDTIELIGYFNASQQTLYLNDISSRAQFQPIVQRSTHHTLSTHASGLSLITGITYMAGSVAIMAIGLSLLFLSLAIHRLWVFLTFLSIGLVAQVGVLGFTHLNDDWENTRKIVFERLINSPRTDVALHDHVALYLNIDKVARTPIDRAFHARLIESAFSDQVREMAQNSTHLFDANIPKARLGEAWQILLIILLSIGFSAGMYKTSFSSIFRKRFIEGLPLTSTRGAAYGSVRMHGKLYYDKNQEDELVIPKEVASLAQNKDIITYKYQLDRKLKGDKKADWRPFGRKNGRARLILKDDKGSISIQMDKVDIFFPKSKVRYYTQGEYRYKEKLEWIDQGETYNVIGHAGLNPAKPDTLIIKSDGDNNITLARHGIRYLMEHMAFGSFFAVGLSVAALLFGSITLVSQLGTFSPDSILYALVIIPIALLFNTAALHYNDLLLLRNRALKSHSNILVQLKKRATLWPQINEVVKGYAAHEQELLKQITEIRSYHRVEDIIAQEADVSAKIQALAEQYPGLKTDQLISQFFDIMTETENYLSYLRKSYVDTVEIYNTRIHTFPDVLLAKPFKFEPLDMHNRL